MSMVEELIWYSVIGSIMLVAYILAKKKAPPPRRTDGPPFGPPWRGSPSWPCEECGQTKKGSTRDNGWMRCNMCGYPGK